MQTECSTTLFEFAPVEDRKVVAGFDGGTMTSNAGGLLLGGADKAIKLIERVAKCFVDRRDPSLIEHSVATLVGQRIFGLALGYEDLNDHDALRHDPLFAVLASKLKARRTDCAPVAGKSTLNRLERSKETPSLYHKIGHDGAAIEKLLVDLFLHSHASAAEEIILDLDATDHPLHGVPPRTAIQPWRRSSRRQAYPLPNVTFTKSRLAAGSVGEPLRITFGRPWRLLRKRQELP